MRRLSWSLGLFLGSSLLLLPHLAAQDFKDNAGTKPKKVSIRELAEMFKEELELEDFPQETTLAEALKWVQERFRAKGKHLSIFVDKEGFKEENPDADEVLETKIKAPARPMNWTCGQFLQELARQIPTNNGACWIRPHCVEITTQSLGQVGYLLAQKVQIRFIKCPLDEALEHIYELTGVTVNLDPRAGRTARIPITANFTNNVSVETVLFFLSEMAGLKLVVGRNVVHISTPAHAERLRLELLPDAALIPSPADY